MGEPSLEPGTGTYVKIPKGPINMSTPDGKAKAKKLILDLTVSDRRNARGVNSYKAYNKRIQRIYNPPKKNQSTPSS